MTIDQLEQQLAQLLPQTTVRDDKALRTAAENKYTPLYNQEVESAKQTQSQKDLALAQQIERLMPVYEQGKASIAQQTESGVRTLERQALSRGMQRSSYLGASTGNVEKAGINALAAHEADHTMNVSQINAQRAQLEGALAETLGRLGTDREQQIAGYMDDMRESDRKSATSTALSLGSLQLQIAKFRYQQEQDTDKATAASSKSSGKKSSAGKTTTVQATDSRTTGSSALMNGVKQAVSVLRNVK